MISIALIILGLAGFIASLAAITHADIFQGQQSLETTITTLKWTVFGLGLFLFFLGFFGLYGICKDNKFFLTIYIIFISILCIAFFAVGIAGLVMLKKDNKIMK